MNVLERPTHSVLFAELYLCFCSSSTTQTSQRAGVEGSTPTSAWAGHPTFPGGPGDTPRNTGGS